jgi:hypothetical protein
LGLILGRVCGIGGSCPLPSACASRPLPSGRAERRPGQWVPSGRACASGPGQRVLARSRLPGPGLFLGHLPHQHQKTRPSRDALGMPWPWRQAAVPGGPLEADDRVAQARGPVPPRVAGAATETPSKGGTRMLGGNSALALVARLPARLPRPTLRRKVSRREPLTLRHKAASTLWRRVDLRETP